MKVKAIYQKFKIDPKLKRHLLRVTKLAIIISGHWSGRKIDTRLLKKACLLHDLGNIVKLDEILKTYPNFLGKSDKKTSYWLNAQAKMAKKYSPNKSQATINMLKEIKADPKTKNIISAKSFTNVLKIKKSNQWELKILFYADARVGPFGIKTLKQSLNERLKRYPKYKNRGDINKLIKACYQIEAQIQKNLNIDLSKITDKSIEKNNEKPLNEELLNLEI